MPAETINTDFILYSDTRVFKYGFVHALEYTAGFEQMYLGTLRDVFKHAPRVPRSCRARPDHCDATSMEIINIA